MKKFTANWEERLPVEIGIDVINNGVNLGCGGHDSGCYWSGYEKDGKYYISLCDYSDSVWETSYEDMELYCLND